MTAKKILAVEDDKGARDLYKLLLEGAGYEVATAPDATAGIMLCAEFRPDMLVLDWDTPGGGGKRVFEKVCQLLGRELPVLFITGFPGKIDVGGGGTRLGILKKPANIQDILAEAERLLSDQAPTRF